MINITFDTHDFFKNLKKSGFDDKKSQSIVEGLKSISVENSASRNDLLELKIDILKWVVTLALGQYILLLGILAKLI